MTTIFFDKARKRIKAREAAKRAKVRENQRSIQQAGSEYKEKRLKAMVRIREDYLSEALKQAADVEEYLEEIDDSALADADQYRLLNIIQEIDDIRFSDRSKSEVSTAVGKYVSSLRNEIDPLYFLLIAKHYSDIVLEGHRLYDNLTKKGAPTSEDKWEAYQEELDYFEKGGKGYLANTASYYALREYERVIR